MADLAGKRATYEDLYRIPDNWIGEIIDGELVATPRPSVRHAHASSVLGNEVGSPYHLGRGGGPGGWVILYEVEVMLGEHLLLPDLAGWRKERFPGVPDNNWISIAPDWICEILSPNTVRIDKVRKMPIYAQYMEPLAKMLMTFLHVIPACFWRESRPTPGLELTLPGFPPKAMRE